MTRAIRGPRQWAAALVQRLAGRRFVGPLLVLALPRRLGDRPPRHGAPWARPVNFPQIGRGRLHLATLPAAPDLPALALAARRRFDVVVSPSISAEALAPLCAAGVPLRRESEPPPADARERELRSIALRRAAHLPADPPEVSVLLPSRRPDDIAEAIRQVGDQAGCRVQVVVGLHGDHWPDGVEESLARDDLDLGFARYSSDLSLGAMLSAMTQRADAPLITKWDDDDWYGAEHILDLVAAYEYSGADVVGKAAEFVYLEGADTTIRRMAIGAEAYSSTIAGGTLLMSEEWLQTLGGWPDVRTAVDRDLLAASAQAGGSAYRTHGFGYVLRRRADGGHTWTSSDDYFLDAASETRPGLNLNFAGIDDSPQA